MRILIPLFRAPLTSNHRGLGEHAPDLVRCLMYDGEDRRRSARSRRAPVSAQPTRRTFGRVSGSTPTARLHDLREAAAQEPDEPARCLGAPLGIARPGSRAARLSDAARARAEEHAADLGLRPDTRFLGWVSPADLEGLYALASCFVFPSLYEGFGLPVLEAMERGVPVACSNRGSLAEVAGGAARLFDPESPRSIAEAIEALLSDPAERERLAHAGRANAARFTWAETARRTLRTYELALAPR